MSYTFKQKLKGTQISWMIKIHEGEETGGPKYHSRNTLWTIYRADPHIEIEIDEYRNGYLRMSLVGHWK